MVDTLSRADRTLEGRWWRRDVGGKMVRFVVCRKGDRHVIAARDGDMIVLQRIAPAGRSGGHGDDGARLGHRRPTSNRSPVSRANWRSATTANQLAQFGIEPASARMYADIIADPGSWVEITANERHPGGTYTQADVAAGCAGLPAGSHRVDSAAGQRRAVRQLPAGHQREPAACARRADGVPAVPGLVRPDRRRRPCGLAWTEKGIRLVDDTPPHDSDDDATTWPRSSSPLPDSRAGRRRISTRSSDYAERTRTRTTNFRSGVHRDQSAGDGDGHDVHGRPRPADRPLAEGDHDDRNRSRRRDRRHRAVWPRRTPGRRSTPTCSRACAQQGHDDVATRDFLARDLDLPSPDEANAARAQRLRDTIRR